MLPKKAITYFAVAVPLIVALSVVVYVFVSQWPGVKFTEVRAYAWSANGESEYNDNVILKDMALSQNGLLNKDGAVLSSDQTKRLIAAVTGSHPEHPVMKCFWPHNAFVFYNAEKTPVAYVEICFDCLIINRQPVPDANSEDLVALAQIFEELKLPTGKKNAAEIAKSIEDDKKRKTN